jgi:predicted Zn-ribbon and HTH transcriptional regulator
MNNIYNDLVKRKKQKVEVDKTGATPNIKCKECGMQFRNKETLEIHRKKAH